SGERPPNWAQPARVAPTLHNEVREIRGHRSSARDLPSPGAGTVLDESRRHSGRRETRSRDGTPNEPSGREPHFPAANELRPAAARTPVRRSIPMSMSMADTTLTTTNPRPAAGALAAASPGLGVTFDLSVLGNAPRRIGAGEPAFRVNARTPRA